MFFSKIYILKKAGVVKINQDLSQRGSEGPELRIQNN
jgi:hypothetical protein